MIEKLLAAQDELNGQLWWPQFRQQLRVWTTESGFEDSRNVYAPDDGFAVEIFAKCVPIAWNPTQARLFAPFLKALGCRSLAGAIRATLVGEPGDSLTRRASTPPFNFDIALSEIRYLCALYRTP